jgi:hypothetical protein
MPPSRKRAKSVQVVQGKSAATTIRKKMVVRGTQSDDSDASSAIMIVTKRKVAEDDSGTALHSLASLMYLSPFSKARRTVDSRGKRPVSEANTVIRSDDNDIPQQSRPKSRQKAKPQVQDEIFYLDDGDFDSTQGDHPARKGRSRKPKSNRASGDLDSTNDHEDIPGAGIGSKHRARSTKSLKTVIVPESSAKESQAKPLPKEVTKGKVKSCASIGKANAQTSTKGSRKRLLTAVRGDKSEPNFEESVPLPTARKRAKIIAPPASDDETLVNPPQSTLSTVSPPGVRRGKSPKL